ncbi:hypothetical protein CDL15_Pgr009746 [Punica granatum]|uniref:Protein kinase domain-containing protein n=1 Tax=Punica granatum TaxID=22663 RepID=A0A218WUS5_PUNGR|nr:hypothetical protein CDL15_Pgr009746 [Punica granatum]
MAFRIPQSSLSLLLALLASFLAQVSNSEASPANTTDMYAFCSDKIQSCNASLYYSSNGLSTDEIASLYSVKLSQISNFTHQNKQDYLIQVPCSCQTVDGIKGYFYNTSYTILDGDTFYNVSSKKYNGQAYEEGDEQKIFNVNAVVTIYLMCGCIKNDDQEVVTYTVQPSDTLLTIASMLSSVMSNIQSLSRILNFNEDQNFILPDLSAFGSERPIVFTLEEIEDATSDFAESKKIGEGGYGSVYFGVLVGGQVYRIALDHYASSSTYHREVAVKKMRSSKSKEFLAELKVLVKIHHINVVELLGYASREDHLYLVYEYVQNGSLNDHLHDPLLKGHQPLSWTARTQIALKTSNILLDEGLRAKVADFGLAKLVGRTNEEDLIATRLVGTPGYLPPESVKELQVTPKTDVFAFGVVLAELITGQRALTRDNNEPPKLKSLITVVNKIFREEDPESALEAVVDGNLRGSYPMEDVCKDLNHQKE